MVPNASLYLIIDKLVVTNKHHEQLFLAYSTPALKETLCRRNPWNAETFLLVDWEHFHAAFEKVFKISKKMIFTY